MLSITSKRLYSSTARRFAEAASSAPATALVLNFVTPHAPIMNKKTIASVTIPGEAGEYGVTVGHSPIISQLQPGIVTITHTGVINNYFVSFYFFSYHNDMFLSSMYINMYM